jgi:indolepyruvate decarboxylase
MLVDDGGIAWVGVTLAAAAAGEENQDGGQQRRGRAGHRRTVRDAATDATVSRHAIAAACARAAIRVRVEIAMAKGRADRSSSISTARPAGSGRRGGTTVGRYLIQRLQDYGVRHVFGIPGDYVLGFYDQLSKSPIQVVGTVQEDGAGFAADAYARINGIGAVCVTYCVGGLSVANAIAGAYAEKSPVVVLSGSPGLVERVNDPLLHHKVKTFSTQKEIFQQFTVAATVLDDLESAFHDIDEALRLCWQHKRPVYIELPRDQVDLVPRGLYRREVTDEETDQAALQEALDEAVAMINRAKKPVILADVEVHRFGLAIELTRLAERTGIPVAVTILGKSVIGELHPSYIGVYEGAMGRTDVRAAVEESDCLLMLGTFLTDVNLGIFTARLDRSHAIEATSEKIQVSRHRWDRVGFGDFMRALANADIRKRRAPARPKRPAAPPPADAPMKAARLFELLNGLLDEGMAVICDIGLSLFGSIDLIIHRKTEFLAPAYYTSMGFAVPGALGLGVANRELRPVVLVGDGAFQMTGLELSSIARQGLDPIVVVLNNRGYTTERFIKDGPYNDLLEWRYEKLPELLGVGHGVAVSTEREFADAWVAARARRGAYTIINVALEPMDGVPALERVSSGMATQHLPKKA